METPNLPAIIEPTSVELANPAPRPRPVRRLQRPEWLGIGRERRQAAKSASWRAFKAMLGRLGYELLKGIWLRLGHLIRWFFLGMKGWLVLIGWVFAIGERDPLPRTAPRSQRKPGQAVSIGRRADRLAWIRAGVVVVPHVVGAVALYHYLGEGWPYLVFAPGALATVLYGFTHDEKPPPPVVAPRARQDVSIETMNGALRAIGILADPTPGNPAPAGVRLAAFPTPIGGGTLTRWDLPVECGKEALDVVKLRGRLAGSFATKRELFFVEPGDHDAQFTVWQAGRDPFDGPYKEHPLLRHESHDVWEPAPFAHNARGEIASTPIVFTGFVIAALPRAGKSFAARSVLVGPVMDPTVRFHCFCGKKGETWLALKPLCGEYIDGGDDDEVKAVAEALERLVADMRERGARIPGSKITPQTARDPNVAAPVTVVVVDEIQEYVEHEKYGKRIVQALSTLGKVGPSTGYTLVVITQKPDDTALPTKIRNVLPVRIVLTVFGYVDSNVALGSDMSKYGYDASKIKHQGVAYFRPDRNADGRPDADFTVRQVRTFGMDDETWELVCQQGVELRDDTPALEPPHVDGDEMLPAAALAARFRDHAPDLPPPGVLDGKDPARLVGEWLSTLGVRSQKLPGGTRARSRAAVEAALDLPAGALTRRPDPAQPDLNPPPRAPHGQPAGTIPGSPMGGVSGHPPTGTTPTEG